MIEILSLTWNLANHMPSPLLLRGNLVLPAQVTPGALFIREGRIVEFLRHKAPTPPGATVIDVGDHYLSPGFIDLHVHGGGGGDFMDGTQEAFQSALRSHVRHGTTRVA